LGRKKKKPCFRGHVGAGGKARRVFPRARGAGSVGPSARGGFPAKNLENREKKNQQKIFSKGPCRGAGGDGISRDFVSGGIAFKKVGLIVFFRFFKRPQAVFKGGLDCKGANGDPPRSTPGRREFTFPSGGPRKGVQKGPGTVPGDTEPGLDSGHRVLPIGPRRGVQGFLGPPGPKAAKGGFRRSQEQVRTFFRRIIFRGAGIPKKKTGDAGSPGATGGHNRRGTWAGIRGGPQGARPKKKPSPSRRKKF